MSAALPTLLELLLLRTRFSKDEAEAHVDACDLRELAMLARKHPLRVGYESVRALLMPSSQTDVEEPKR